MGTVNALGLSVAETWENAVRGVSGVAPITRFDASDLAVRIACEVKGFDVTQVMEAREARRRDRFEHYAAAAVQQALRQSGLQVTPENAGRVAVVVSSAIGGLEAIEQAVITILESGPRRVNPFTIPMIMANGAAGLIAIDTGAKGPCFSIASACASGADAIGQSWHLIRSGVIDAAIAGAAESTITKVGIATFDRVGAMSRRNDEHWLTPAPFDKNRDGLVMGEGSGILILEPLARAQARGAPILAELAGYAATADAFHVTAPAENGEGGAAAITNALQSAGLRPAEVDYINAHGTATPLNDLAETRAIKSALGDHAYRIPVSSTKSMTGHMMGATGALEAILCVQAIRTGMIPPTVHLHTPDPECDLDYVPNQARKGRVRVAVSNAFGFGGHNAVLVVREFSG
jgi:beta-ketoacyl-acyl-carrier-protein synthase II